MDLNYTINNSVYNFTFGNATPIITPVTVSNLDLVINLLTIIAVCLLIMVLDIFARRMLDK